MKLMGVSLSPYVRKVMAYTAERGIAVELEPASMGNGSADFERASPFRKMPAFVDGDFAISDSSAIVAYLEAKFPEGALIPSAPASRARTVWFEEYADTILLDGVRALFFQRIIMPKFMGQPGDLAAADQFEQEKLPPLIDYLESVIPPSGYLVDDRLTLADLSVASMFINLDHAGVKIDEGRWPKVNAYLKAIWTRPSFAGTIAQEKALLSK